VALEARKATLTEETKEATEETVLLHARARSGSPDSGRDSHLSLGVRICSRDCDGDAPCLGPTARICVIAL
jgi:hypothetical protein